MGTALGSGVGGAKMLANRSSTSAQEKLTFLNCRRLPGRLNTSETALLLGFSEHDIAFLIAAKLLVPLGKPAPNAPKFFATVLIEERVSDAEWLSKATRVVAKCWLRKNSRKSTHGRSVVRFSSANGSEELANGNADSSIKIESASS
jgi:hypothetical protein